MYIREGEYETACCNVTVTLIHLRKRKTTYNLLVDFNDTVHGVGVQGISSWLVLHTLWNMPDIGDCFSVKLY